MLTVETIERELKRVKALHYDAVGEYSKNPTSSNLNKVSELYGQIIAYERVLCLR